MTGALLLALGLLATLVLASVAGSSLLRASRFALARRPLLSAGLLLAALAAFAAALIALGPALAWALTGPRLIPAEAGAVCQRCLNASSPFSAAPLEAGVPGAVLLAGSALVAAAFFVSLVRELVIRGPRACTLLRTAGASAESRTIGGRTVRVIDDDGLCVFAVPPRCGGITLSRGVLDVLDAEAVSAVVEHEAAHLRQRHHLISAVAAGIAAPLRWVPFAAACEQAILECLEIAADEAARSEAGTAALVRALIALGGESAEPIGTTGSMQVPAGALFATGGLGRARDPHSARVRSLVGDRTPRGRVPALGLTALLAPLTAAGTCIHVAAGTALLTGCALS